MMFRTCLTKVVRNKLNSLKENRDSSKEIINSNVLDFEDMGMTSNEPGAFSKNEITDKNNLVNTANMADECDCNCNNNSIVSLNVINDKIDTDNDIFNNLLDISVDTDDNEEDNEDILSVLKKNLDESTFTNLVYTKLKESQYAAPLDYVPDVRINSSDVLAALKREIGDGSEALSINKESDEDKNDIYKISNYDVNKLPKELSVENVVLTLDGDGYKFKDINDKFPKAK